MGLSAGGEDIEDDFGAVEDFALDDFLDIADLRGAEVVIENDDLCIVCFDHFGEFADFAFAHKSCEVWFFSFLGERVYDNGARGVCECADFA